jgi:hypothetical protein
MGDIYVVLELHPCNHRIIQKDNIKTAFKTTNTVENKLRKTLTTNKYICSHWHTQTSMFRLPKIICHLDQMLLKNYIQRSYQT